MTQRLECPVLLRYSHIACWITVAESLEFGELLAFSQCSQSQRTVIERVQRINLTHASHCKLSLLRLCPMTQHVRAPVVEGLGWDGPQRIDKEMANLLPYVLAALPCLKRITLSDDQDEWDSLEREDKDVSEIVQRLLHGLCLARRAGNLGMLDYIDHGWHECERLDECICGFLVAFFPVGNLFDYISSPGVCVDKLEIARIALLRGADPNAIGNRQNTSSPHNSKTWFDLMLTSINLEDSSCIRHVMALNYLIQHGNVKITDSLRHEVASDGLFLIPSRPRSEEYASMLCRWVLESTETLGPLPLPTSFVGDIAEDPYFHKDGLRSFQVISEKGVPILESPRVNAQVLGQLEHREVAKICNERIQLHNGRRFLQLENGHGWVSAHSHENLESTVIRPCLSAFGSFGM